MMRNLGFALLLGVVINTVCAFSEELKVSIIPQLQAGEKIVATLEIIASEKNYTLHVFYTNSEGQQRECFLAKRVQSYKIQNNECFLFYRVADDGGRWPGLFLLNGITGQVSFLGNFPDYCTSSDGKIMFSYIPKRNNQIVGVGVVYNVETMEEIVRYDFTKELINKYSNITQIGYFAISAVFNVNKNGFELLFDQYEEQEKLTCSGIITLDDMKFHFTDRKKELLKIMGFK
jgi:hypothetical protein